MNKAFIVGRLTKAPEMRTTTSGISVCTLSIATPRRMNRDETVYHTVIAWRGLADNCGKYLEKGQMVAVAGEIETRSYEDKSGAKRYVTEIIADDIEFLAKAGGAKQKEATAEEFKSDPIDDEGFPF